MVSINEVCWIVGGCTCFGMLVGAVLALLAVRSTFSAIDTSKERYITKEVCDGNDKLQAEKVWDGEGSQTTQGQTEEA